MRKITILYCLLVLGLFSCTKDIGNYNYRDVAEITIDTIENQIVTIFNKLNITPNVSTSLPTGELAYAWYRYNGNELETDTLSTERDLDIQIKLPVGLYKLYYSVKDKSTGLGAKTSFNVNVVGKFETGLMVLSELGGITNFHFINSAGDLIEIYGSENGSKLGSKPVALGNTTYSTSSPGRTILTDVCIFNNDVNGGVVLNNYDFIKSKDCSQLFFANPSSFTPEAYYRSPSKRFSYGISFDFIIGGGKLYSRLIGASEQFDDPIGFRPEIAGDYDISKWAIAYGSTAIFYDKKAKCFLTINGDYMSLNTTFSKIQADNSNIFDPANIGMDLVYMSECSSVSNIRRGFGIFKDSNNKLVSKIFSLNNYSDPYSGSDYKMSLIASKEVSAPNIDKATGYAMSIAKPFLFYSFENKIYQYNIDTGKYFEIYNIDNEIPNSTIDKIYMEYLTSAGTGYGSVSALYNQVLYVASSQKGTVDKNGSLCILELDDNGTFIKHKSLFKNNFGKIIDMKYKR